MLNFFSSLTKFSDLAAKDVGLSPYYCLSLNQLKCKGFPPVCLFNFGLLVHSLEQNAFIVMNAEERN